MQEDDRVCLRTNSARNNRRASRRVEPQAQRQRRLTHVPAATHRADCRLCTPWYEERCHTGRTLSQHRSASLVRSNPIPLSEATARSDRDGTTIEPPGGHDLEPPRRPSRISRGGHPATPATESTAASTEAGGCRSDGALRRDLHRSGALGRPVCRLAGPARAGCADMARVSLRDASSCRPRAPAGHARRRRRDDGRGRRLIDLGPLFVSAAQFAGVRAAGPRAGLRRGCLARGGRGLAPALPRRCGDGRSGSLGARGHHDPAPARCRRCVRMPCADRRVAQAANGVYAGVFFMVAALELYGTAIGTWTWSASVPVLGLSAGNPPSGARADTSCSTSPLCCSRPRWCSCSEASAANARRSSRSRVTAAGDPDPRSRRR